MTSRTILFIWIALLLSLSLFLQVGTASEYQTQNNGSGTYAPSLTNLQICEVRYGDVLTSTCSSTAQALDFTALYISVTGLEPDSPISVSGSTGIPVGWTSDWNAQPSSACGAPVCENGFYDAMTNASGSFSGYSYCSVYDNFCSGTGQGAASAPQAGQYKVTVCTGSSCTSDMVSTVGTTTSSTTTSTTTTVAGRFSISLVSIGASSGAAGSYVEINATAPSGTGTVHFSGKGPNGANFPSSYCTLSNGWCTVSVQLASGAWAVTASFGGSSSQISLNIPTISSPQACVGNTSLTDYLYVANSLDNSISQYAVSPNTNAGSLCSLGPPVDLPPGSFPSSLTFTSSGEQIWGSGGWATGSTQDAGTLSIITSSNCILGLDADGGDGHLLYAGQIVGTTPGDCLGPQSHLDQPVGFATLSYDGGNQEYILNQGNSTITQLAIGATSAPVVLYRTLEQPENILSDNFPPNQNSAGQYCVFVDNQTMVEGYDANVVSNKSGSFYVLQATTPINGEFSSMLLNPSPDIQGGAVRVLYALSSSQNEIYELQIGYGCALNSWKTVPTGPDPIGMIDIGTSYLYVLNSGYTGQASISTFAMNNTISTQVTGDGSLTPVGNTTPAGFDAVAIGTDATSYSGKWPGDEYFFVADAGSQTIDEYAVPASGLPQYVAAIPSQPGASAFASGYTGSLGSSYVSHAEFETVTLPDAYLGEQYSYTIPLGPSSLNAYPDMTLYSGSLPPGLVLHTDGKITGTPSSLPSYIGNYTFSVEDFPATLVGEFTIALTPPVSSNTTQTTTTQSSSSSTCGRSCNPPGINGEWSSFNMTVSAMAENRPLSLGKTLTVSWIQIDSTPTGQKISSVAYNDNVLQVKFDKPGPAELTLKSSLAPTVVYADGSQLSQSQESSFANQGYYYNETSDIITIFADPSSITLFYGSASSTTSVVTRSLSTPSTTSSSSSTMPSVTPTNWYDAVAGVLVGALIVVGLIIALRHRKPKADTSR